MNVIDLKPEERNAIQAAIHQERLAQSELARAQMQSRATVLEVMALNRVSPTDYQLDTNVMQLVPTVQPVPFAAAADHAEESEEPPAADAASASVS